MPLILTCGTCATGATDTGGGTDVAVGLGATGGAVSGVGSSFWGRVAVAVVLR